MNGLVKNIPEQTLHGSVMRHWRTRNEVLARLYEVQGELL